MTSTTAGLVGALFGSLAMLFLADRDVKRGKSFGLPPRVYDSLAVIGGAGVGYVIGQGLGTPTPSAPPAFVPGA